MIYNREKQFSAQTPLTSSPLLPKTNNFSFLMPFTLCPFGPAILASALFLKRASPTCILRPSHCSNTFLLKKSTLTTLFKMVTLLTHTLPITLTLLCSLFLPITLCNLFIYYVHNYVSFSTGR